MRDIDLDGIDTVYCALEVDDGAVIATDSGLLLISYAGALIYSAPKVFFWLCFSFVCLCSCFMTYTSMLSSSTIFLNILVFFFNIENLYEKE